MIMDKAQQKIDVRISEIIVSISPAAVRTLIGVTSSLGALQVRDSEENKNEVPQGFVLDNGVRRKRKSEFQISVYTKTV